MPSSLIRSFHYDAATRELDIVFQSGLRYVYLDVPEEVFRGLSANISRGQYFNDRIRENFSFRRAGRAGP